MDLEAHPELIFGEEFCFPATVTYYPTLCAPAGINVPTGLNEQQTVLGRDNQGLHYPGHQADATSCMYYVVPDYGIAHSPNGPHPLHLYAIADGRLVGAQEPGADTVEHTYHQAVPTSHYAVLPSAAERTVPSTAQSLSYTNGLFIPGGLGQTVAVAPERGVAWNPSLQPTTVSSMKFQDHTMLPKVQLHRPAPWKRQLAAGNMMPAKPPHDRQSLQVSAPSIQSSLQTNWSYNNHVSNVGSELCKTSAERSQPRAKTRSYANQRLSFMSQQNKGKAERPIGSMSSEIIVKSYTSRLHIGNPEGQIIIRTDQYNRDDFQVLYPNAKFFVIKSFDEADIHKSIKYGVWSTSSTGNRKLDSAFREAQAIAASSSTLCPVFLYFSVNGSLHFCGVAEMVGPVDFQKDMDFWCKSNKWIGSFPVRWHIIKNVPNSMFRSIVLQNNGHKPVTSSRDTQEIHYTPGTTMLKIFKYTRAEECLLDEFMVHEEEEAMSRQHKGLKLRRGAPQFMPASRHARRTHNTLLPRSDSVLMDRMARETNRLTDELQGLNLERHQGSWQEFRNLTSKASSTNTQKESRCYVKQAHESIVKATYQAYQPVTSNMNAALDGQQQYWKKVEISPSGKTQSEAAACVSSKVPEYPTEDKIALVQSASGVPETTCEEQKIIGKPCSLATSSEISEACSKSLTGVVIGSMLVPIAL